MKLKKGYIIFIILTITGFYLSGCDYYLNTNIQSNSDYFSKSVNGTYYTRINGNFYSPDPSFGVPWIALSSYGTYGANAYYAIVGLPPSQVLKLTVSIYSFDNGNDVDGAHIHVYNLSAKRWDYWGSSDKSEKWHSFYTSGNDIYNYIANDGTVFIWVESGWLDHTHLKYVSITERKRR